MCTIESVQIMLNIVGLFPMLSIKRLDYIGMLETHVLKRITPMCDGPEYQQESIQLNSEFYEIQKQIFLQILKLIKIKDKDSLAKSVQYLSELIKLINLPNYKKGLLDPSLNDDIQEAMDTAQKTGNYELRDKIIEYKAKTYKLNDLPANI